jgi:hypothetical protein
VKANGYLPVRRLWEMAIDLLEEPEHPTWPESLRLATFEVGQEHAVHDATNEAFRDHSSGFRANDASRFARSSSVRQRS